MKLRALIAWLPLVAMACADGRSAAGPGASDFAELECIDDDGDGYGQGCDWGRDCDDTDPQVFEGCLSCGTPAEGCACEPGTQAVSCFLDKTEDEGGNVMCHEGTRYCRRGVWSSCEDIHSYPLPEGSPITALVDSDAGPVQCSDCNVKCFVITDNLDPVDGGLIDTADGTGWAAGGGLTLSYTDAGFVDPDAALPDVDGGTVSGPLDECMPGTAPDVDCDGITDDFDPFPFERPFETNNPAIFLDLAPGQTGTGTIDLVFFMNSVDVYFLLDQTDSMQSVRNRLQGALVSGTFLGPEVECADTDLDNVPNNELKNEGVLGGIKCLLRNAHFGTGFFREIPFTTYGNDDEILFKHMHDITDDPTPVRDVIASMVIDRDVDWPDADPLAIYSVVTGEGHYMGLTKPGVPTRTGCPEGTWGYPCFRPDAIPVIFLFTDSPMHQGPPTTRDLTYDPTYLTMTTGSELASFAVPSDNETLESSYDLGDITNSFVSYTGSTEGMTSDYGSSFMTCAAAGKDGAPDATFSFELSERKTVAVSTTGSAFAPGVAIYNQVVSSPKEFFSDDTNELSSSALELMSISDDWAQVTGDTSAMAADYAVADLGCGTEDAAPDAVVRFSLETDTTVAIDTTGSAFDTVIGLYDTAPALTTVLTATNENDDVGTPFDVGDVFERIYAVRGGDTSVINHTAVYTEAQMGCGADDTSPDAVYRFELSEPTRVRMSTANADFKTVLGLADGALGSMKMELVPPGNDTQDLAHDIGDALGIWTRFTGSTAGHLPDYRQAFIGCNADTFAPDTVMKLSVSESTRLRFDASGSSFDTVMSLHDGDIDPTTPMTTDNSNETAEMPMVLGEVDDSWFEVFGGDTTLMTPSYTDDIISCGADTSSADAVFAFNVVNQSRVQIDTIGASFDTVVSLHDRPPPRHLTTAVDMAETIDIGSINEASQRFTGTTVGLAVDHGGESMGCGAEDSTPDKVFQFTVTDPTELEINTEGSDFDTVIGLFPDTVVAPAKPASTPMDTPDFHDAGTLDFGWIVYSGDTTSAADDYGAFGCSAADGSNDAQIRFHLDADTTVHIDTLGSTFDTVVGVFDASDNSVVACDQDSGPNQTSKLEVDLTGGRDYYILVKGDKNPAYGPFTLSIRDEAASNAIMCNDDAFVSGRSRLVANLLPGTYNLMLKGADVGHEGNFAVRFTDRDWWAIHGRIACDDNSGGGFVSLIDEVLDPGTYYVVVKGDLAVDEGPFRLTVRSLTSTIATTHVLTCDDDSGTDTASMFEVDVDPGDYYLVMKGKDGGSGVYDLEVRDIGAGGQGLVLTCHQDDAGNSVIERDLGAGIYYAFVKGDDPLEGGAYDLQIEDVTNTGGAPLACDDDSASGGAGASRLEGMLTAGDYWVVLKGDTAADSGAYSMDIRDVDSASRSMFECTDAESFTVDLDPGNYDLLLKGVPSDQQGDYVLTIGDGVTKEVLFTPPDWNETLNALKDTETRVITALNCHDNGDHGDGRDCDYAQDQARTLANATDALGPDLSPLVVDIDSNGTGVENAIMTQLTLLSGHLQMDVMARVVFEPDANPGFIVNVEAIDRPGDGCDGLIGIEHQNCRPGATPTFNISFTNPLDNPVPLNPDDPNGGYHFRADLIADQKYFVDAVPIYVIPQDVDMSNEPPEPQLEATGSYWQDLSSPGCEGNDRPDWQDLFWTAEVPSGTAVEFHACTAETEVALDDCDLTQLARIEGTLSCSVDSDCATGYCASNGVCNTIRSGECFSDGECPLGSTCNTSLNACIYAGQPVYVGTLLGSSNLQTNLRMNILLEANTTTNEGPTVHDWSLTYLCRTVN